MPDDGGGGVDDFVAPLDQRHEGEVLLTPSIGRPRPSLSSKPAQVSNTWRRKAMLLPSPIPPKHASDSQFGTAHSKVRRGREAQTAEPGSSPCIRPSGCS